MIVQKNENNITTNIGNKSEQFSIQTDEKLFHVLSNLYSDPLGSVVRELSTNCLDAHALNGYKGPFTIHLPNEYKNTIVFRDYGPGLNQHEINTIYKTYGVSTKRDSNDFTGCLGLGSKSPFALVNSFSITSIYKGHLPFNKISMYDSNKSYKWYINMKSIYNAYKDANGIPNIVNIMNTFSNDKTGMAIEISMSEFNKNAIIDAISYQLRHFDPKPIIEDGNITYKNINPIFSIAYIDNYNTESRAVMGSVHYELNLKSLLVDDIDPKVVNYISAIRDMRRNIILFADLGDLTFAPNREQLIYDKMTIANIEKIILNHIEQSTNIIISKLKKKALKHKFIECTNKTITNEMGENIFKHNDLLSIMMRVDKTIINVCEQLDNYVDYRIKTNFKSLIDIKNLYMFDKYSRLLRNMSNRNIDSYDTKINKDTKVFFIQAGTRNQIKLCSIICKRYKFNRIIVAVGADYDVYKDYILSNTPVRAENFIDTRKFANVARTKRVKIENAAKRKSIDLKDILQKYKKYISEDYDENTGNIYYIYCRIDADDRIIVKEKDNILSKSINEFYYYDRYYTFGKTLVKIIPNSMLVYVTNKDDINKMKRNGCINAVNKDIAQKFDKYINKLKNKYKITINNEDKYIYINSVSDDHIKIFKKLIPKAIIKYANQDKYPNLIQHSIKELRIDKILSVLFDTHGVLRTIGISYRTFHNIDEWIEFFNNITIDIDKMYQKIISNIDDHSYYGEDKLIAMLLVEEYQKQQLKQSKRKADNLIAA